MYIFDHFEWLSTYYDRVFKGDKPVRLIQLAELPTPGVVLDAGGGTGRIAEQLVNMAGSIIVVDYSVGMLRQAVKKNCLHPTCGQTEKLPFASNSFDRVIMVDTLHHVFDQRETLQELWRVLKPGGRIVIEEPDVRSLMVKLLAVVEKLLFMRSRFISPTRLVKFTQLEHARMRIDQEGYKSWVVIAKDHW